MKEKLLKILEEVDTKSASSFQPAAACKEKVLQNALAKYAKGCEGR